MAELRKHVQGLSAAMEAMDPETHGLLLLCLQDPVFHDDESATTTKDELSAETPNEVEAAVLKRGEAERERYDLAANFIGRLTLELVAFDAATDMAEVILSKPARGQRKERWRERIATEIAWVFWLRLDVEPTATQAEDDLAEDSAFESVLKICFRALGMNVANVHRPALAAMKSIKVQKRSKK